MAVAITILQSERMSMVNVSSDVAVNADNIETSYNKVQQDDPNKNYYLRASNTNDSDELESSNNDGMLPSLSETFATTVFPAHSYDNIDTSLPPATMITSPLHNGYTVQTFTGITQMTTPNSASSSAEPGFATQSYTVSTPQISEPSPELVTFDKSMEDVQEPLHTSESHMVSTLEVSNSSPELISYDNSMANIDEPSENNEAILDSTPQLGSNSPELANFENEPSDNNEANLDSTPQLGNFENEQSDNNEANHDNTPQLGSNSPELGSFENSMEESVQQSSGNSGELMDNISQDISPSTEPISFADLMANVKEPFDKTKETPVLWKLMRTGNVSLLPYLSDCLNLVLASEVGVTLSDGTESNSGAFHQLMQATGQEQVSDLRIVTLPSERRYVNVDTTTVEGLQKAKEVGLISSGLADVVVSPYFQEATTTLFENTDKKARFFTVMRHPVEKVVSKFYFLKVSQIIKQLVKVYSFSILYLYADSKLQKTSIDSGKNAWIQNMSLLEYINSDYLESNFMVRNLINKKTEILSRDDIEAAKQILAKKFLVGLSDKMSETMERIRLYFDWQAADHMRLGMMHRAEDCKAQYLKESHVQSHKVDYNPLDESSEEWQILWKKNWADLALYEYVSEVLFKEQGLMFPYEASFA